MKTTDNPRQEAIKAWFDKTYATRGEWYLRPVEAYYIFLELLGIEPGTSLLDVACGLGRLLEAGQSYPCQLHGVDLSSVAVEKARQKIPSAEILQGNAEQLPFADACMDYLTCLGSLERMIDKGKALREMHRVAKPGARFCFLVRNADSFFWKNVKLKLGLQNKTGNQGACDLETWTRLFEENGFSVGQVLHDQYPLHKRKRIMGLGLSQVDYKSPVPTKRPISQANEFLFLLHKK